MTRKEENLASHLKKILEEIPALIKDMDAEQKVIFDASLNNISTHFFAVIDNGSPEEITQLCTVLQKMTGEILLNINETPKSVSLEKKPYNFTIKKKVLNASDIAETFRNLYNLLENQEPQTQMISRFPYLLELLSILRHSEKKLKISESLMKFEEKLNKTLLVHKVACEILNIVAGSSTAEQKKLQQIIDTSHKTAQELLAEETDESLKKPRKIQEIFQKAYIDSINGLDDCAENMHMQVILQDIYQCAKEKLNQPIILLYKIAEEMSVQSTRQAPEEIQKIILKANEIAIDQFLQKVYGSSNESAKSVIQAAYKSAAEQLLNSENGYTKIENLFKRASKIASEKLIKDTGENLALKTRIETIFQGIRQIATERLALTPSHTLENRNTISAIFNSVLANYTKKFNQTGGSVYAFTSRRTHSLELTTNLFEKIKSELLSFMVYQSTREANLTRLSDRFYYLRHMYSDLLFYQFLNTGGWKSTSANVLLLHKFFEIPNLKEQCDNISLEDLKKEIIAIIENKYDDVLFRNLKEQIKQLKKQFENWEEVKEDIAKECQILPLNDTLTGEEKKQFALPSDAALLTRFEDHVKDDKKQTATRMALVGSLRHKKDSVKIFVNPQQSGINQNNSFIINTQEKSITWQDSVGTPIPVKIDLYPSLKKFITNHADWFSETRQDELVQLLMDVNTRSEFSKEKITAVEATFNLALQGTLQGYLCHIKEDFNPKAVSSTLGNSIVLTPRENFWQIYYIYKNLSPQLLKSEELPAKAAEIIKEWPTQNKGEAQKLYAFSMAMKAFTPPKKKIEKLKGGYCNITCLLLERTKKKSYTPPPRSKIDYNRYKDVYELLEKRAQQKYSIPECVTKSQKSMQNPDFKNPTSSSSDFFKPQIDDLPPPLPPRPESGAKNGL